MVLCWCWMCVCIRVVCACACVCVVMLSLKEKKEEDGRNAGKERKRKDSLIKRARFVGGCVLLLLVCFLGEAGRAFSLKKIGAPARLGECTREREVVFSFSSF